MVVVALGAVWRRGMETCMGCRGGTGGGGGLWALLVVVVAVALPAAVVEVVACVVAAEAGVLLTTLYSFPMDIWKAPTLPLTSGILQRRE